MPSPISIGGGGQHAMAGYEEAIDAYQRALVLRVPEPEEVMTNLAALYSDQLGRPDLAREWLDRAVQSRPDYYPAHFNLGHLAEQLGDRPAAMTGFEQAALLRTDDPVTLGRLLETLPKPGTDDARLRKLRHLASDGRAGIRFFSLARVRGNISVDMRPLGVLLPRPMRLIDDSGRRGLSIRFGNVTVC